MSTQYTTTVFPSIEFLTPNNIILEQCKAMEFSGRTCWKSEERMNGDSYKQFLKGLITKHHESVLEHSIVTVKLITNIGVARELERHRHTNMINDQMTAISQESTRYCNYSKDKFGNKVTLCLGTHFNIQKDEVKEALMQGYEASCGAYLNAIKDLGAKPDLARSLLPLATKTQMIISCSIREWRAILKLRTARGAHPDAVEIATMILDRFKEVLPELFEDINPA